MRPERCPKIAIAVCLKTLLQLFCQCDAVNVSAQTGAWMADKCNAAEASQQTHQDVGHVMIIDVAVHPDHGGRCPSIDQALVEHVVHHSQIAGSAGHEHTTSAGCAWATACACWGWPHRDEVPKGTQNRGDRGGTAIRNTTSV